MSLTLILQEFSAIGITMTIIMMTTVGPVFREKMARRSAAVAANAEAERQ
jgi:hypothetical protein